MSNPSPLAAILAECRRKLQAGESLDRQRLLAEHPEHAEALSLLFAGMDLTLPVADVSTEQEIVEASLAPATVAGDLEATIDLGRPGHAASAAPGPLRSFGDYELLSEIARGGMGVVYRARQVSLNRIVALKMILAGQLAGEDDLLRFRTEAEAAARLQHPNIVQVYDVGEENGQHFFSMEFI